MNPWISIWTAPRETMKAVGKTSWSRSFWFLAWIYGFSAILNAFQAASVGNTLNLVLILSFSIVFAPIWGWLVFSFWSLVVYWVGKLLKGGGTFQEARAAFAWASVPLVLSVLCWVVLLFFFGSSLFQNFPESQQLTGWRAIFLFSALMGKIVGTVWSLVAYINTLAAVQKFSIARSIMNIVFSWVAIGIVLGVLWLGLGYFSQESSPMKTALVETFFRM